MERFKNSDTLNFFMERDREKKKRKIKQDTVKNQHMLYSIFVYGTNP